jgi:hypothetical protein
MVGVTQSREVHDPVLYSYPLSLRKTFYPLGFPVSIATNSEAVLSAAEESWSPFEKRFSTAPLTLRLGVNGDAGQEAKVVPTVRAQRDLIGFVGDGENFLMGDLAEGTGFGWFTPAVAHATNFFRYHYLEALAMTLIDARYAAPMHAACVVLDGKGVTLCGDSGAGKSSLAYACARRGWQYASDDATYLLPDRSDRTVVGNPHRLRLRPDAGQLFPELKDHLAAPRGNGKISMEIATARHARIRQIAECRVDFVVYLRHRTDAPASLAPFSREAALADFGKTIALGSPEQRSVRMGQFRNLLEVPVNILRYSALEEAVETLAGMVRSGA